MDLAAGNRPTFEKMKDELLLAKGLLEKRKTKAADCRRYGYNGTLVTIAQDPEGICGGYIIEGAQPAACFGYWYSDSSLPVNRLFIEDHNPYSINTNVRYKAEIKSGVDTEPNILASCLFSNKSGSIMSWDLALLWEVALQLKEGVLNVPEKKKRYITCARLSEVEQQGNIFDLDKNKIEIMR